MWKVAWFNGSTYSKGYVAKASTPPAIPPEMSETMGGVLAESFMVTRGFN